MKMSMGSVSLLIDVYMLICALNKKEGVFLSLLIFWNFIKAIHSHCV